MRGQVHPAHTHGQVIREGCKKKKEKKLGHLLETSLYLSSGAAAAALPVPTDFWLFISLLKSKIYVKVVHPFIILSISVQSVLLPSVLSSRGLH